MADEIKKKFDAAMDRMSDAILLVAASLTARQLVKCRGSIGQFIVRGAEEKADRMLNHDSVIRREENKPVIVHANGFDELKEILSRMGAPREVLNAVEEAAKDSCIQPKASAAEPLKN